MRDLGRCFQYPGKEKTHPFTEVPFQTIRPSTDFHHIWSLSMKFHCAFLGLAALLSAGTAWAQTDTTGAEEDFSQYENLGFADDGAKRFCTSKVLDLSPQKLISIGIDFQGPHTMSLSALSGADGNLWSNGVERQMANNHGLRIAASIPVISKNSVIWTVGGYYWANLYKQKSATGILPFPHKFDQWLQKGIRTTAVNTTVFKPVNEKTFWLFQAQAEVNGDYGWDNVGTAMEQMKFGGAILYGKKPHDRLQWAVGAVQTWRAGEINYIPALLYNYTWPSRKYGAEVLFPARAAIRRTFNPRNLLFFGYELEGASYWLQQGAQLGYTGNRNFELRRSELRFRFTYEHSLHGFFWLSVQGGMRMNYSFNADEGNFFRGFFYR
jgi:hypothetical protein